MMDRRSAKIVSFAARATNAPMEELRALHGYWEGLRAGRRLPLRSEIDPRDIAHLLESGFLLEHVSPGNVRFRLAGMKIGDLMGMDVRSMPVRAIIAPAQRPLFSESLERVFSGPEMHTYLLTSDQIGMPPLQAAMIILPLLSEDGEITRAIGTLVIDGKIGATPRRFKMVERMHSGLDDEEDEQITCFDEASEPVVAFFAESQAEFTPAHPKAPHLRLVKF